MTSSELATMLDTDWLGKRLAYYDETDSTNVQARKLAESGAPHGTLAAADCQTAGKGPPRKILVLAKGDRHMDEYSAPPRIFTCLRLHAYPGGGDGRGPGH